MFKKIDPTKVVVVDRDDYDERVADREAVGNKLNELEKNHEDLLSCIATILCEHDQPSLLGIAGHLARHYEDTPVEEWTKTLLAFGERLKGAQTPAPRVTLPSLDEEAPKFKRGDIVRRRNTFPPNQYKVIGFDRNRVEIQTTIPGELPGRTYVEAHELELVPPAPTPAPKFKRGDRVIDKLSGALASFVEMHPTQSDVCLVKFDADRDDSDAKDGRWTRIEGLDPAPAPDDGAYLSDAEDRELVAMGREIWKKWAIKPSLPLSAGAIADCANRIQFEFDGREMRDLYDSSVVPRLTDANRALLRRVARERKAEKGSE